MEGIRNFSILCVDTIRHKQNIICNKTHSDRITHEQYQTRFRNFPFHYKANKLILQKTKQLPKATRFANLELLITSK